MYANESHTFWSFIVGIKNSCAQLSCALAVSKRVSPLLRNINNRWFPGRYPFGWTTAADSSSEDYVRGLSRVYCGRLDIGLVYWGQIYEPIKMHSIIIIVVNISYNICRRNSETGARVGHTRKREIHSSRRRWSRAKT